MEQILQLQEKIERKEKEILDLENKVQQLSEKVDSLNYKIGELEGTNDDLEQNYKGFPKSLIPTNNDEVMKLEVYAQYKDKFNFLTLEERLKA